MPAGVPVSPAPGPASSSSNVSPAPCSPGDRFRSPHKLIYSPSWKKRSFKVKMRRRISSMLPQSQPLRPSEEDQPAAAAAHPAFAGPGKRKNPFSFLSSTRKKWCPEEDDENGGGGGGGPCSESRALVSPTAKRGVLSTSQPAPSSPTLFDDDVTGDKPAADWPGRQSHVTFSQPITTEKQADVTVQRYPELPSDVSLRSKVRIVSQSDLSHLRPVHAVFDPSSSGSSSIVGVCHYYQHPHFPWCKLFPRRNARVAQSEDLAFLTDYVKSSLFVAWNSSLQNVYDLLRQGALTRFYLCSSNLTMMFENDNSAHRVCIVPTTRGFRDTLFKQGIQFSMPHLNSLSNADKLALLSSDPTSDVSEGRVNIGLTDDGDEEEEDASCQEWLAGLGAAEVKMSSSQKSSSSDATHRYDYTKQSLITIPHQSVHTLFNFLLNFKSLMPSSGELAGLPPTIVCDRPFLGASLQQLSSKVVSYRTTVTAADPVPRVQNALEVFGGPILPSVYTAIVGRAAASLPNFTCLSSLAEGSDSFRPPHSTHPPLSAFAFDRGQFVVESS